jgi:hypothetical protein
MSKNREFILINHADANQDIVNTLRPKKVVREFADIVKTQIISSGIKCNGWGHGKDTKHYEYIYKDKIISAFTTLKKGGYSNADKTISPNKELKEFADILKNKVVSKSIKCIGEGKGNGCMYYYFKYKGKLLTVFLTDEF